MRWIFLIAATLYTSGCIIKKFKNQNPQISNRDTGILSEEDTGILPED